MSNLLLRYSEGYDASISGWTGALDETYFNDHYPDWLQYYVAPAQVYVAKAQTTWDAINDPVFDAFRSVGYQFLELWPAYAVHHWPGVVGFKDPLTFLLDDPESSNILLTFS